MARYSRRHYLSVSPPADTPQAIAERQRHYARLAQVRAEVKATYPVLDATNIDAALAFQERRIRELVHSEASR